MKTSRQTLVLRQLYREEYPEDDFEFPERLIDVVARHVFNSRLDAERFATQQNINRYWNALLKKMDQDRHQGLVPLFDVIHDQSKRLRWYAATRNGRTGRAARNAKLSRTRPAILKQIDALSSRQFEALGCVLCDLLGAEKTHLTPAGNEGGIDFFAALALRTDSHIFHGAKGRLRIIGQCKKHDRPAEPELLRSFTETINEVKNVSPSIEGIVPDWFRTRGGPVVGWLISHAGTTSGAATKAKNHGFLVSDALDCAEVVCLSRAMHRLPPSMRATDLLARIERCLQQGC